MLQHKTISIHLEEIRRLGRMIAGDVVERHGGDIVGFAFADEGVVLEEVLFLGVVDVAGLRVEDAFGFSSM
jgi:hypothetical protein